MLRYLQKVYNWYYYVTLTCDNCGVEFQRLREAKVLEYNCCSTGCCHALFGKMIREEKR